MINICLSDPQELFRAGIDYLFDNYKFIKLITSVSNGKEMLPTQQQAVDVYIISSAIADISVVTLIKRILRSDPKAKILILANETNPILARQYLQAGARGYLAKTNSEAQFIEVIKKISADKIVVLPPELIHGYSEETLSNKIATPFESLSNREMDILLLMAKGKSIKEISKLLHLSPKTISTYKGRIYEKLNINTSMELFLLAIKYGLINLENVS